ncbi:MAG: Abi family protein [Brumimicrobium sp.]|nr:Abi family protein [Brumimicrobium sp.]
MGRIATTVEEQIEILKSRGMELDLNEDKIKEHLLDIGYYRLGFYWFRFINSRANTFKPNTRFSTIIQLYYLDKDLKSIIMRALNRIEINIRTQLIYQISNYYKNSPTWFVDRNVMKESFIQDFPNFYNIQFKKSNKPIKEHHKKHINDIYAPAWKTLEFMTFGSLLAIFRNLKNEALKESIAGHYGLKKSKIYDNYFGVTVFIRNICAHGGVLYDAKTPKSINSGPLNLNDRHSLYAAIRVILFLLEVVSENRKNEIENEIINLFNAHKDNLHIKSIIEEQICYHFK